MNTHAELAEAMLNEWTWKTSAMRDMTLAVCQLAIHRAGKSFSALDLPKQGEDDQGGSGIAGSVFKRLKDAGIITRVGQYANGTFYADTVFNAGGNPIGVYRLANAGLAHALIRRHDPHAAPLPKQEELQIR